MINVYIFISPLNGISNKNVNLLMNLLLKFKTNNINKLSYKK